MDPFWPPSAPPAAPFLTPSRSPPGWRGGRWWCGAALYSTSEASRRCENQIGAHVDAASSHLVTIVLRFTCPPVPRTAKVHSTPRRPFLTSHLRSHIALRLFAHVRCASVGIRVHLQIEGFRVYRPLVGFR
eukprot:2465943-Pyramimonas_sp.AAC.1